MKKINKTLNIFLVLFVAVLSSFFVGCKYKIKLSQPSSVQFQTTADGRQCLMTDENIYADKYLFGISSSSDADTEHFIKYEVETNYFDVTNIFEKAKKYYFFAQALGSGNYLNSEYSKIYSYVVTSKLDSTTVALNGTLLSWKPVANAQTYSVWAVSDGNTSKIATKNNSDEKSTQFDISAFVSQKDSAVSFYVRCDEIKDVNGNTLYLSSADSNSVSYSSHLQLEVPKNFQISKNSDTSRTLSWNAVSHCTSYDVLINNSDVVTIDSNETSIVTIEVFKYYNALGKYTFKVKANKTGNYISSDYCAEIFDTYVKQLDTPQNVKYFDSESEIVLKWNEVENAESYALYIDGKEFVLNDETGVSSSIVTNSITLSFSDLNISSLSQFDSKSISILAKGYGYYLDSEKSTQKTYVGKITSILETPHIIDDNLEAEPKIQWNLIENATKYTIYIKSTNDELKISDGYFTNETYAYFYYKNYIANAGKYTISVQANALTNDFDSPKSNEIVKETYTNLLAPKINDVYVDGSNFCVDFNKSENANSYTLFVNNQIIDENFEYAKNIDVSSLVSKLGSEQSFTFCLKANANNFYKESSFSNNFVVQKKLSVPTSLKLENATLSWNKVKNAQNYYLFLDDKKVDLGSTSCAVNLINYVSQYETRQIRVVAVCNGLDESNATDVLYFNNVLFNDANYTQKYFYYGKTYDYYITSQNELNVLCRYVIDNYITVAKIYMTKFDNYNFSNRLETSIDSLTGTMSLRYSAVNGTNLSGETTLNFNYLPVSPTPTYTSSVKTFAKAAIYKTSTPRNSDYDNFVTDKYIVSQDVYFSDSLISAVENHSKPNFINANSTSELVYEKAKTILREICDDTMTDYQKALAIHDYLVNNINYDYYGLSSVSTSRYVGYYHYVESALLSNLAVCDGYAKSFSLLCNMEGIDTLVVGGFADKHDSDSGHAWNKIYLDADGDSQKEWLVVDCTFDDSYSSGDNTEYGLHDYFMISDSDISGRSEDIDYPASANSNCDYFNIQKIDGTSLVVDNAIQLYTLENYVNKNKISIEIIVKLSVFNTHSFSTSTISLAYSMDSNYKLVILYKS